LFFFVGIRLALKSLKINNRRGKKMSMMIKELALSNLFIIWLIIFGGFAFLKILKRQLEDW